MKYFEGCEECACYNCSQQDNCSMNGCDGGCERDDLCFMKDFCDNWEPDFS